MISETGTEMTAGSILDQDDSDEGDSDEDDIDENDSQGRG